MSRPRFILRDGKAEAEALGIKKEPLNRGGANPVDFNVNTISKNYDKYVVTGITHYRNATNDIVIQLGLYERAVELTVYYSDFKKKFYTDYSKKEAYEITDKDFLNFLAHRLEFYKQHAYWAYNRLSELSFLKEN